VTLTFLGSAGQSLGSANDGYCDSIRLAVLS
jgi:hypothetical protein